MEHACEAQMLKNSSWELQTSFRKQLLVFYAKHLYPMQLPLLLTVVTWGHGWYRLGSMLWQTHGHVKESFRWQDSAVLLEATLKPTKATVEQISQIVFRDPPQVLLVSSKLRMKREHSETSLMIEFENLYEDLDAYMPLVSNDPIEPRRQRPPFVFSNNQIQGLMDRLSSRSAAWLCSPV